MKRYFIFILLAILLVGCTNQFGENEFHEKIANLENSLNKEDWDLAKKQMDDLSRYYNHNLWKVQLVGGEGEYKDLYEAISRLTVLIEERDHTLSRMELETIKTLIEHIYSL